MSCTRYWAIKSTDKDTGGQLLPLRWPELHRCRKDARAAQKQFTLPKEQRINCKVIRVRVCEE